METDYIKKVILEETWKILLEEGLIQDFEDELPGAMKPLVKGKLGGTVSELDKDKLKKIANHLLANYFKGDRLPVSKKRKLNDLVVDMAHGYEHYEAMDRFTKKLVSRISSGKLDREKARSVLEKGKVHLSKRESIINKKTKGYNTERSNQLVDKIDALIDGLGADSPLQGLIPQINDIREFFELNPFPVARERSRERSRKPRGERTGERFAAADLRRKLDKRFPLEPPEPQDDLRGKDRYQKFLQGLERGFQDTLSAPQTAISASPWSNLKHKIETNKEFLTDVEKMIGIALKVPGVQEKMRAHQTKNRRSHAAAPGQPRTPTMVELPKADLAESNGESEIDEVKVYILPSHIDKLASAIRSKNIERISEQVFGILIFLSSFTHESSKDILNSSTRQEVDPSDLDRIYKDILRTYTDMATDSGLEVRQLSDGVLDVVDPEADPDPYGLNRRGRQRGQRRPGPLREHSSPQRMTERATNVFNRLTGKS